MTRRFNLLPASYLDRIAERKRVAATAGALVVLVAALVLAGVHQRTGLARAGKRRDVAQAQTNALTARRAQLGQYRLLVDAIGARERLLSAAMGTEVSWAGVLTSVALNFPADASLTSLNLESTLPPLGGPAVASGDQRTVIGSGGLKGYSVKKFTPGVERLLQQLDRVTGLSEPRLQVGAKEEIGKQPVTTFQGSAFLDAAALTARYAHGLPVEDAVELPAVGAGAPDAKEPSTPAAGGVSK